MAGAVTFTRLDDLELPLSPSSAGGGGGGAYMYTARDVYSQAQLTSNSSGFLANVTGYNATLVLVTRSQGP